MISRIPNPDRRAVEATVRNGGTVGTGTGATPWNLMVDFGRQQFAVSTEATSLMFRGTEAMRKIQQQAAHEASLRHHAALQKLQTDSDPGDLLAVQTELLRLDVEQASRYWQQLARTAMQTQMEILGCAGQLFAGRSDETVRSVTQAFQRSMPDMDGAGAAHINS